MTTWMDRAKVAYRWFSVQAFVLAGAMQSTWLALPDDLKAYVPAQWVMVATVPVCALGIIGRLAPQKGVPS